MQLFLLEERGFEENVVFPDYTHSLGVRAWATQCESAHEVRLISIASLVWKQRERFAARVHI